MVFKWKTKWKLLCNKSSSTLTNKRLCKKNAVKWSHPIIANNRASIFAPYCICLLFFKVWKWIYKKKCYFYLTWSPFPFPVFIQGKEDKISYTLFFLFSFFFPTKNAFNLEKLLGKRKCSMSVVPYFFLFFLDSVGWKVK